MKIRNINSAGPGATGVHGPEGHKGTEKERARVFERTLSTMSSEQREKQLNGLIRGIDEQSEKLAKKADIREFERYRSLIREFLQEVVSNGYSFSKESAFNARGRHRFLATVKTIDEKLDGLAKDVLSGQSDSIDILGKIDDIRGLLLDVMT